MTRPTKMRSTKTFTVTGLGLAGTVAALVACAAAATACSGAPAAQALADGGFPDAAFTTATGDAGTLLVEVRTSPQPPSRGTISAELTVVRATDGAPLDGLALAVHPWMPAMAHGTSVVPTVQPLGGGKYLVTELDLYMTGTWALQTTATDPTGANTDYAAPTLDIP